MGSEQSSQNSNQNANNEKTRMNQLRRGKSVPNHERIPEDTPPRCTSPGASICSDSDLPYISYTVNRPIGDSPKMTNKQSQIYRGKSIGEISRQKNSLGTTNHNHKKIISDKTHSIVVVKPAQIDPTADKDPDIVKLQSIPMFLPIMRGTLNLPPGVRDPEVLERLDPVGLFNLCARYQHHLNTNAQIIAAEQVTVCASMETEFGKVLNLAVDRQKKFAKFTEQINKVHELSRQLTRCHSLLNQTLESLETLNNLLPIEERLEPFVWTTG
ncbi:PREDICTED: loss of heterozygosity 12 chromosomal region 1 protein homolog [Trachymyrmex cornetzi]|uniref:loss of heterozygosity 12 chromosomal region 1 protein homolog n=1 Tax=Trachymyrmex cornetzi TaxID=471704 RepID=UPI00084F44B4|nr:PREDICTED: loss of heterozygosity 12 chromosomal region 1 protein homolog [Trachymyrmex cornetzi]XP_018376519.1 PREDICTED: loss of heterozygosity 12 chromosomal region 1 protein homolog [Trachymyrmex cornetzi]XP_018376520.1 PREDICTED: loss of heterozygosity 12 chromosomal region 1 protein homolog [Trachymyrmex cornetzi]